MKDRMPPSAEPLTDPDALGLIIPALSAISSIASLAVSWIQWRSLASRRPSPHNYDQIRKAIRQLERNFDDLFEDLRSAIRIMDPAFEREHGSQLHDQPLRFGTVRPQLTNDEITELSPIWQSIGNNFAQVNTHTSMLLQLLRHSSYPGEDQISSDHGDLNNDLNAILFESKTYRQALDRLYEARRRTENFLLQLKGLSN